MSAPPTRGEHQRIAACLSALDALQRHKPGLMQQMQQLFPSPEEAEG